MDYLIENVCHLVKGQTMSIYLHFPSLLAKTRLGGGEVRDPKTKLYKGSSKILRLLQEDHQKIIFIIAHTVG